MTGTNLKKLKIMNVLKNNIWFLLVLPFLFGSCEQEDLVVLNSDATTTVTVSSNEIVLLKENEGTDAGLFLLTNGEGSAVPRLSL